MSKCRAVLGLGTGWMAAARIIGCVQSHLSVHRRSEKMPLLIGFSSVVRSLIDPVIPLLDIGRFSIC